jgi:hypothetical protein
VLRAKRRSEFEFRIGHQCIEAVPEITGHRGRVPQERQALAFELALELGRVEKRVDTQTDHKTILVYIFNTKLSRI